MGKRYRGAGSEKMYMRNVRESGSFDSNPIPSDGLPLTCHGGGMEDFMSHGTVSSATDLATHRPRRPSIPESVVV